MPRHRWIPVIRRRISRSIGSPSSTRRFGAPEHGSCRHTGVPARKVQLESKMRPKPRATDPRQRGSGKLDGRVALITGGDSGIGRAVAVLFAKEGANLSVTYLNGLYTVSGEGSGGKGNSRQWRSPWPHLDAIDSVDISAGQSCRIWN